MSDPRDFWPGDLVHLCYGSLPELGIIRIVHGAWLEVEVDGGFELWHTAYCCEVE